MPEEILGESWHEWNLLPSSPLEGQRPRLGFPAWGTGLVLVLTVVFPLNSYVVFLTSEVMVEVMRS